MIIRKVVGKILGKSENKSGESSDKKSTPTNDNNNDKNKNTSDNKINNNNSNNNNTEIKNYVSVTTHPERVPVAARFRTHIQTDKNIYKPTETVYVRGFVVNAFDYSDDNVKEIFLNPEVSIVSPKGDKLHTFKLANAVDGTIWMTWEIPADIAGGDYILEVDYPANGGFAFAQREFNIRVFRPPRLKTQLEFTKKGYGAGDRAQAKLEVERAEGGFPVGATVTAVARIDGSEVFRGSLNVNDNGKCFIDFDLPKEIETGVGTLSCVVEDGGVVETASKTIPIILQSIDIDIYPEGGDLVAGVESGLYISAFTPVGDPADISAEIVLLDNGIKTVVGQIETEHEGRGRSRFTPEAGKEYHLQVIRPTGIKNSIPLPAATTKGVSLLASKKIYQHDEAIEVIINSTEKEDYTVTLYKLDVEIASAKVSCEEKSSNVVQLIPDKPFYGVLRVTVSSSKPLAERLIFRKPKDRLNIQVIPDKAAYTPGASVSLTIKTSIGNKPVQARVGVIVTDDSVRKMTEKRKRPPQLLPMVFLEDEVEALDDSHVYFKWDGKKRDKAENAIDLLLGTQGWRRFIYGRKEEEMADKLKRSERLFVEHKATQQINYYASSDGEDFDDEEGDFEERFVAPPVVRCDFAPLIFESALSPAPLMSGSVLAPGLDLLVEVPEAKEVAIEASVMQEERVALKQDIQHIEKKMERKVEKEEREREHFFEEEDEARFELEDDMFIRNDAPNYTREYAHAARVKVDRTERSDFTETLYWIASVMTNEKGEAIANFSLNDSVTTFAVLVDGISSSKENSVAIGSTQFILESKQPFYIEPKMPLEVTAGDIVQLPIAIVNNTESKLSVENTISISNIISLKKMENKIKVDPMTRVRSLATLVVSEGQGNVQLTVSSSASNNNVDKVIRSTKVVPSGFPYKIFGAGVLTADVELTHEFTIPKNVVPASVVGELKIFTSPASNLTEAMQQLIQEPCGCFEQTSSTVYPLTMALKYFNSHKDSKPDDIKRSQDILKKGYARLTSFECKKGGYDWFGSDPASEFLTSYGVLEFSEMEKVMPGLVDKPMLNRTLDWLLSRKTGDGTFATNARFLHTWNTQGLIADAYILYSLVKAGIQYDKLEREIEHLKTRLETSKDPYILAMQAHILFYTGDKDGYAVITETLKSLQKGDGSLQGAATITSSNGKSLLIETTSLCMLAWLLDPQERQCILKGAEYLFSNCELGSYGNTQSTVLAIEAIIAYDIYAAKPKSESEIQVLVNNKVIETIQLNENSDSIEVLFGDKVALEGTHKVTLKQKGNNELNYAICVSYYNSLPDSNDKCSVSLDHLLLRNHHITEGEGTEIEVKVRNKTKEILPMTMVIIGLPGGLELRHEKMKELVKSEKIASYEVLGARRVVCYFRGMKESEEVKFEIDVVAAVPGEYTGPASCAYLYYTKEYKHWVKALKVKIDPR